MNNYKIITTDAAKKDVKNISSYIAKDNVRAAIAVTKLFKNYKIVNNSIVVLRILSRYQDIFAIL